MLAPGAPALNRDEALKLLRQLEAALREVSQLRRSAEPVVEGPTINPGWALSFSLKASPDVDRSVGRHYPGVVVARVTANGLRARPGDVPRVRRRSDPLRFLAPGL